MRTVDIENGIRTLPSSPYHPERQLNKDSKERIEICLTCKKKNCKGTCTKITAFQKSRSSKKSAN